MGLFHHKHDHDQPEPQRYQMREKLLAIGDDYWIENSSGDKVYKVNGKAVRFRQTFILEDPNGGEVAKIQERKSMSTRSSRTVTRSQRSPRTGSGSGQLRHRDHPRSERRTPDRGHRVRRRDGPRLTPSVEGTMRGRSPSGLSPRSGDALRSGWQRGFGCRRGCDDPPCPCRVGFADDGGSAWPVSRSSSMCTRSGWRRTRISIR